MTYDTKIQNWKSETDHVEGKKKRVEITFPCEEGVKSLVRVKGQHTSEMEQGVSMSEKSFISMAHKLLFR